MLSKSSDTIIDHLHFDTCLKEIVNGIVDTKNQGAHADHISWPWHYHQANCRCMVHNHNTEIL